MNNGTESITVLHLIEHLRVGGAERVVADLIQGLDPHRFNNILLLYRAPGTFARELRNKGCRIVLIKKDRLSESLGFLPGPVLAPVKALESLLFVIRLALFLRREKVDLVHAHMFSANLWGLLAARLAGGIGMISTEHTVRTGIDRGLKHRLVLGGLLPLSDKIVAVSREVAESIRRYQDLGPDKLVVIANGVTLPSLDRKPSPASLPGQRPRIVAVSRLVRVKRLDILLRAMHIVGQQHPGTTALIVGNGPDRAALEDQARELGLADTLFFLGQRTDVADILQGADIFVNTSDQEGLPRSILEAMAARLPVVATDVGGTGSLVRTGRTGILVRPGDHQAVADAITELINDPDRAAGMGRCARELVRDSFSLEQATKLWEKLYNEVADRHRPPEG
ncbi:MAG: glycosyltransferase [Desulfobacterales bacterium]|nr:glycosyltransferase [Desulfobacterales bacterium]